MITTLATDWIWLAILAGGVLIGVGIRGLLAERTKRRIQEDARQESVSAQFRLDEAAGKVTALEQQLAALRHGDELLRQELATARRQVADLEALTQRLRASENQLREQQTGWYSERALLLEQLDDANRLIAASNEAIASLEHTRLQLQQAETRFVAQQTQHDEKIALLARQLSEQEASLRGAMERGGEIGKIRSRLAELEPRARMAADWQARHDIVQSRLAESDNDRSRLRHRLAEAESRIAQLDNSLEERDQQIRRIAAQLRQGTADEHEAQRRARDSRIRELENTVARLRQRVLELEPLRGELQIREHRLQELLSQQQSPSVLGIDRIISVEPPGKVN